MLLYCSFSALSLLIICRAAVLVFSQRLMLFLYWKKTDALNKAVQGHLFLLFPSPHPLKSTEFEGVLLVEKDMNQYVLSLLANYPQTSRKIELMRYELHSLIGVSPQEIIEVMSFAKNDSSAGRDYPHSVPEIAFCYKDVAKRLNREVSESVLETYITLLRERDRLHHHIGLLEPRQAEIIKEYYFLQRSWSEISKDMGISLRTAYAIRQQAVDSLVSMYTFTGIVFSDAEPSAPQI